LKRVVKNKKYFNILKKIVLRGKKFVKLFKKQVTENIMPFCQKLASKELVLKLCAG